MGGLRAKAETSQQYLPASRKCGENVVEELDCGSFFGVFRILVGRPIRSDFHLAEIFGWKFGNFPGA